MRKLFLLLVLCLAGRVAAQQPGELDSTFSDDGLLLPEAFTTGWFWYSWPHGLISVDADLGFTIAVNLAGSNTIRFLRLLNDGSVDPTFGNMGIVELDVTQEMIDANDHHVIKLHQDADGLLVFARGFVFRLNGIGELNPSFGINGFKHYQLDDLDGAVIEDVAAFSDGDFGMCGWVAGPSCDSGFLVRLDAGCEREMDFGSNGVLLFAGISNQYSHLALGVTEMEEGRIATVVKTYEHMFGHPSGSIRICDMSGVVLESESVEAQGWLDPAGDPIVFNGSDAVMAFAGELQQTLNLERFGVEIEAFTNWPSSGGSNQALAADQSGAFFAGGNGWSVQRRLSDGAMDQIFGQEQEGYHGIANPFTGSAGINMMHVQPDGKLIVVGRTSVSGQNRMALARYHNIPDPRSTLSLRMFLGGAYDSTTFLMRDEMRQQGLVPALQPYAAPFFSAANGVGSWATPQHVLQTDGDSAVVDWVWLELLSAADSATIAATRVGLLHRDGWVTSADGHSPIDFSAGAGSYFVRARHRNHLGVTASQAVTLGPSVTTLDLTDPATPTFGTDAQKEVSGVRMLWPGDAVSDGAVKYLGAFNDRDRILLTLGGSTPTATLAGYRTEDLNLDGVTKYVGTANDRDIILQTNGGSVTAVRVEQRP